MNGTIILMSTQRTSHVLIRSATAEDIEACLKLDHSLETQHIWQMTRHNEGQGFQISFQTLRLPRPVRVEYPRSVDELRLDLADLERVLVAEAEGVILGYSNLTLARADRNAWVRNLVVHPSARRHRVGRALFERCKAWAQLHHADHIMLEATMRSYPALRFMSSLGLLFCGFNDRYYTSQDIAIFYGQNL
jgi:GNAT superfamily N-acetyltransferase